jgi:translation elongation factor EF-1beta
MNNHTTIIFPGLGADSTLAKYHDFQDSNNIWIEWPKEIKENWDEFVGDIKLQIPENTDLRNLRFIGISFGGLTALKMAEILHPNCGIYLIGSLRNTTELSIIFRMALKLCKYIPEAFFRIRSAPKIAIKYFFGISNNEHVEDFIDMAEKINPKSVKKLCLLINSWKENGNIAIARIHGIDDKIITPRNDNAIHFINGGHLISMTNSKEISAWIDQKNSDFNNMHSKIQFVSVPNVTIEELRNEDVLFGNEELNAENISSMICELPIIDSGKIMHVFRFFNLGFEEKCENVWKISIIDAGRLEYEYIELNYTEWIDKIGNENTMDEYGGLVEAQNVLKINQHNEIYAVFRK